MASTKPLALSNSWHGNALVFQVRVRSGSLSEVDLVCSLLNMRGLLCCVLHGLGEGR
jgi:hypothetical protein